MKHHYTDKSRRKSLHIVVFTTILASVLRIIVLADPPDNTILGAYVGNDPSAVTVMENWLGRPVDAVLGYVGAADWADWDGSLGWMINTLWADVKQDHMILWSIPLIPVGASLDEAGDGLYNDHYRSAAACCTGFKAGIKFGADNGVIRQDWQPGCRGCDAHAARRQQAGLAQGFISSGITVCFNEGFI